MSVTVYNYPLFQEMIIDLKKSEDVVVLRKARGSSGTRERPWCSRLIVLVVLMKVLVQLVEELTGPLQVGLCSST